MLMHTVFDLIISTLLVSIHVADASSSCSTAADCVLVLQQAGLLIDRQSCDEYTNMICSAANFPTYAQRFSQQKGGSSYAYGVDGILLALRGAPDDAAKALDTTTSVTADCSTTNTTALYISSDTCVPPVELSNDPTVCQHNGDFSNTCVCNGDLNGCLNILRDVGLIPASKICISDDMLCTPTKSADEAEQYAVQTGSRGYGYSTSAELFLLSGIVVDVAAIINAQNYTRTITPSCSYIRLPTVVFYDIGCADGVILSIYSNSSTMTSTVSPNSSTSSNTLASTTDNNTGDDVVVASTIQITSTSAPSSRAVTMTEATSTAHGLSSSIRYSIGIVTSSLAASPYPPPDPCQ